MNLDESAVEAEEAVDPYQLFRLLLLPLAIAAALPLALLGVLLAVIVRSGPADAVRGENFPPVERLTFQRVILEPGAIVASVMNDGPDDISIALETDMLETTIFVRGVGPLKLGMGIGAFFDALNGVEAPAAKGILV